MKQSIKFKVTFWYTCIITINLFVLLGGAFLYSEYYSVHNIHSKLEEEYSVHFATMLNNRLLLVLAFIIPLLIIGTAFLCYRMVCRVLIPVSTITDAVNEISGTKNLSKRLPTLETKDELSYLTDTFNGMLDTLEDTFEAEKQFTSDAAHELRTPLFVIIAHCEYCLEELNLEGEVKDEIEIIYSKAQLMSQLVSQLLLMARAENRNYSPVFEDVNLGLLTELVVEELEEKASKKNITINLPAENDNIVMKGDQILLTRMFINLIDNAISYGRQGGYVNISIQKQPSNIIIFIKDNGIGIPEDELDKIWHRFYRGDKSRAQAEGFGLGLSMVQWIVSQHGGTIAVESTLDEGTCFTINFNI